MKVVETFPYAVREIEHCWIPLPDGCRLAARIWLPEDAWRSPVPAIIEYIPYRKRDGTRWRDEPMHHYFAGHGYTAVRIDLRGSGESDGLLLDEYLPQEQDDAEAAIQWIAAQPWCSGAVGMMGKSWGGFSALQVAARRPPALKAVITVCSTDDRYADDAHYMGGCLLGENLIWGSALFTLSAQPPDPALVGDRWREMWRARLEHLPLYAEKWLRHQRRDEYWKQGSVCENYADIACPVYAVGGWADGYTNAIPRLLAGLQVPRKGLVGPWAHLYPHRGVPGPPIGFLQEALRWWDHWLKGNDTGVMHGPMYRVWMQESVRPRPFYAERPGRWVAEDAWPSPRIRVERYRMAPGRLVTGAAVPSPERLTCRSPQTVGRAAGAWCGFGMDGDSPVDQREDDAGSLVFESEPLQERLEILGAPVVTLRVASDRPTALLAVRLSDVAPEGWVTRVTYGVLNLTRRASPERAEPLEPGRRYLVQVRLNDVAHAFPAGHRVRLSLSTSYWPMVWPPAEAATVEVFSQDGALELPVRPPRPEDAHLPPFPPPEAAPSAPARSLDPGGVRETVERTPAGELVSTTFIDVGPAGDAALSRLEAIDLDVGHAVIERFRIHEDDPLSAQGEITHRAVFERDGWAVTVVTRTCLTTSRDAFHLEAELAAFEGAERVCTRSWNCTVPRELL